MNGICVIADNPLSSSSSSFLHIKDSFKYTDDEENLDGNQQLYALKSDLNNKWQDKVRMRIESLMIRNDDFLSLNIICPHHYIFNRDSEWVIPSKNTQIS